MVTERLPRARVRPWISRSGDHERLAVDLTEPVSVISLQLPFAAIGARQIHLRERLMVSTGVEWSRRVVKRSLDILGSLSLLIVAMPALVLIALAVKASSPGPVIFRHERVGRAGKPFHVWKFRSMRMDISDEEVEAFAETDTERAASLLYKSPNDPRVTPVGKFIRRTGLDELPQFFNVLGGAMSLVGPRPLVDEEIQTLDPVEFRHRNSVRPGVTGLWQVFRRSEMAFEERMRLDLVYVGCQTLWLDLYLMLMTPLALVKGERSY